jgi:hypothetical protein
MKINARLFVEGIRNNVQGKAHYRLLIWCIILGGFFLQLSCLDKYFQLCLCGSLFGYLATNLDEGYRILYPNQNPQNPALNPHPTKTPKKREAARS